MAKKKEKDKEEEDFIVANKEICKHIELAANACDKSNIGLNVFLCELTAVTVNLVFAKFDNPTLAKSAIGAFMDVETNKFLNKVKEVLKEE